ncbi:MAG: hypothetical protein H8D45_25330 [Bacteroidetes bacterium]|nr:hypothetical protein [Bacteroidota bacterium]
MAPYVLIGVFAVIGLIVGGIPGMIIGGILGKIISLLIGSIAWRIGDVGPIQKKYRKVIATNFVNQYEDEINSLPNYTSMDRAKLISEFSKKINEIYDSAIKIDNPFKKHKNDMDYATYKDNFLRGGMEIWINQFENEAEVKLMNHFLFFCVNEIYFSFYK